MLILDLRTLGILATTQSSLAVPDANVRQVSDPADVLGLMEIGFKNRARRSTSMNERSSRSHRFDLFIISTYFHFFVLQHCTLKKNTQLYQC